MKILHIITSMDPRTGGPCQGVRNLAPHMERQGYAMEVVCLDDPRSEYLARETIPVHALGQGRTAWSYHPALRPWLKKNLPRFDAVILNGLWQYPGYVMSRLSQRPSMPSYFVFPHGMLDPWFQCAPGRRLKAIRNWFYWKIIENKVIANARAVLFTCAEEMRLARETFRPYQSKREINVGFGIAQPPAFCEGMVDGFAQKCPGLQSAPYYLFLSRIHPKKGLDLLIRAYAAVYRQRTSATGLLPPGTQLSTPNSQLPRLVIAGPGLDTDYGKKMHALASALCPPSSVLWPGMLTGDAKWGALYCAEAFVLTSHQENFGIAVVESLSCGTPVLISNKINIWREITADRAGLVDNDTVVGAEHLLQQWECLAPEEKAVMKRAAKGSYKHHFGIAGAAQNLLSTIEGSIPL